jgi:hypothetical protein
VEGGATVGSAFFFCENESELTAKANEKNIILRIRTELSDA